MTKMNRLLINMKNKVDVIDGAIKQCRILKAGGKIELTGLQNFTITRGETTDEDFNKMIIKLHEERESLTLRIHRMGG